MADYIYHMCAKRMWLEVVNSAVEYYYPPTFEQDGFIHATKDPSMLLSVANHFYTDSPLDEEWVVLCIDVDRLTSPVTYEAPAPVGDKETKTFQKDIADAVVVFPHIYGGINPSAVTQIMPMERNREDGTFVRIQQDV
ncbi:hypothetical protein M9435_000354 [Picochlorum sp. BPE23]|nr:hypothetical protein M9435_000354 [Picochlorum sp. BPE23]